jgi:hypothetical protein
VVAVAAMNKPAQLYRHYDAQGGLLYVGISLHTMQRLAKHRERSPWFAAIARVTIQHLPSQTAARDAERAAIVGERPRYNVMFNIPAATDAPRIGDALIEAHEATIRDLRARLDQADTDRRQALDRLAVAQERIAALLTDQRPAKEETAPGEAHQGAGAPPVTLWDRFLAWRR